MLDKNEEQGKLHWQKEKTVIEFDNIYDNKGSMLERFANRFLRPSMKERIPLTINECGNLSNKTVLDVGCGAGRLSFLLANEDAKVTGIDYSPNMITLAKKYQIQKNQPNIEFICCDFPKEFPPEKKYDISIAIGVLDYIQNPQEFLKKMASLTNNKMIVSYPLKYSYNSFPRKLWLKSKGCPVFFYSKNEIIEMYKQLGFEKIKITQLPTNSQFPTGYLVTVDLI